eukprot:TRINITY_DN26388_c0_g1_i6.p4 TRINITY_DN26388_c0_g1~~TRINITY_DN26388_c0_g1_i6.p4  ORF type:complete len:206 (-),score=17.89 TRINITY_DN26388_c0_g1_i6:469-1002(-)
MVQSSEMSSYIFTDITEAFTAVIYPSAVSSVFFSLPVITYHVWCMVVPSLFVRERERMAVRFATGMLVIGLGGAATYACVLPLITGFFYQYAWNSLSMSIQLEPRVLQYVVFVAQRAPLVMMLLVVPLLTKTGGIQYNKTLQLLESVQGVKEVRERMRKRLMKDIVKNQQKQKELKQ